MKKFLALFAAAAVVCALTFTPFVKAQNRAQNSGLNPTQKASDARPDGGDSDGRYIIQFRQFGPGAAASVRAAGGEVVHEFPEFAAVAARLPEQALRGLQNNPNVSVIEVDPRRYPMALSDTPTTGTEIKPYGIQMVQADQLSDANASNRKICIIDSGYSLSHEDLQDSSVTASADSGTGDPFTDNGGHGTHVAGTIAAIGGNSTGVVGVLPSSKISLHIVKVFGDDGSWAYSSDLINALGKCRDAGANVVSMSLGGSFRNPFEESAFNSAYNAGVLSIAAAGNAGDTSTSYPAGYGSVVSVAAVDNSEAVASFSQKNSDVEVAAPGVSVLSTVPYIETNTLAVAGTTYKGNHVENAPRTEGVSGSLANGGRCASTGPWAGQVVLCERGDISFYDKVRNVQNSGGVAAVIYNNEPGGFFGTLGDGYSSTIPAISLSQADGQSLSAVTAQGTVVSKVTKPANGYDYFDGTSMATPHVSAVAALVWSYNPGWTNAQIRDALNKTAKDNGLAGRDTSYGYGIVQAKAALDSLQGAGGGGGGNVDLTPPVISNVTSRKTNKNGSFEITWTTNEASNSAVTFTGGTTGTSTNSTMVTSHKMTFRGSKGVTYTYSVSSTDAAGNKATAGPFNHQN